MQQLVFQKTHSLFLGWLLIEQTQYRNMNKDCEEITRQCKNLQILRKLRKAVAIYKTNKPVLSYKYLIQKVAVPDFL